MPVFPHAAEVKILEYVLKQETPSPLSLKLYVNDHTPDETDTVASYTEASGGSYLAKPLLPGNWDFSGGNPTIAQYDPLTWTFTGSVGNVYGYYIESDDGTLMASQRFVNGPYNVQNNGDVINVTPKIQLK